MICLDVVPRTIESSTSSTFFLRNSSAIAFSLRRTDFTRAPLPRHDEGAADVAVLDEAFAAPARRARCASGTAAVRDVSGIGITASMS